MLRYFFVSVMSGIVFGFMDGGINANPYAQKLLEVYKPIVRTSINVPLGLGIDLVYGFVMAGLFLLLYQSLPGETGILKGLSYGSIMWFFRVVMYAATQTMMFKIPTSTLVYIVLTGLVEMLVMGLLFGLTLKR
jgi:hypothetical protein